MTSEIHKSTILIRTTDQRDLGGLRILTIVDQSLEKFQFDCKEVVHDEGPFETLDLGKKQSEHLWTYPPTTMQDEQLQHFFM